MFKPRPWAVLCIFLLAASVQAATLVVYPFAGDDPAAGAAVAQAVTDAFSSGHETYGPAAAPTLAPPFHHGGGFYNPAVFTDDTSSLSATMLLRGATGADLVLNGHLQELEGYLVLELAAALGDRELQLTLEAPAAEPDVLVSRTVRLAGRLLGLNDIPTAPSVDLGGEDRLLGEAIYTAGLPGGLGRALQLLSGPELADSSRARELRSTISAVLEGQEAADAALAALLSLNLEQLDEARTAVWFKEAASSRQLPALGLWETMLQLSTGAQAADAVEFPAAEADWPYGLAARLVHEDAAAAEVRAQLAAADPAALTAYSVMARNREDTVLEKEILSRLARVNPRQASAFERLSFIAFDEDDPLAAMEALAVAVKLEPGSDLYWTNLGWAQYLLRLPEQSLGSSERAVLLAPGQTVAHYNIGLVHATAGRISAALDAYARALEHDPVVNEAALDDLEDALGRYPAEPAVHYARGWLLEAAGKREEARLAYARFLEGQPEGAYAERAHRRIGVLELPPPELRLRNGPGLFLGRQQLDPAEVQAGDPLTPVFEIWTPGEVLPTVLDVGFVLEDTDGGAEELLESTSLTLPADTVGFVVDGLIVTVPAGTAPGAYTLEVTVSASEGRTVSERLDITVGSAEDPLRRLFGYGITLQSISSGAPLFDRRSLGHWEESSATLLGELGETREAAEEVLPVISGGRFSGMTGGEAFAAADAGDLRDFLNWIADPELQGASFVFVDTFAQWIVDGTPSD